MSVLHKLFTRRNKGALPCTTEKDSIKIISFNTHDCEYGKKIVETAADIKRISPDIVCLQELDASVRRSGGRDIPRELAKASEMPYYRFFPAINFDGGKYGLGILSRFPLGKAVRIPLSSGEFEKRVLGGAEADINGAKINIFVTHLSFESRELRKSQFEFLNDFLQDKEPFILCGDFNTEGFGEYAAIRAQCVNNEKNPADTYKGDDVEFWAIDNIFFSDGFALKNSGVSKSTVSDHDIIWAELRIPQDNN